MSMWSTHPPHACRVVHRTARGQRDDRDHRVVAVVGERGRSPDDVLRLGDGLVVAPNHHQVEGAVGVGEVAGGTSPASTASALARSTIARARRPSAGTADHEQSTSATAVSTGSASCSAAYTAACPCRASSRASGRPSRRAHRRGAGVRSAPDPPRPGDAPPPGPARPPRGTPSARWRQAGQSSRSGPSSICSSTAVLLRPDRRVPFSPRPGTTHSASLGVLTCAVCGPRSNRTVLRSTVHAPPAEELFERRAVEGRPRRRRKVRQ